MSLTYKAHFSFSAPRFKGLVGDYYRNDSSALALVDYSHATVDQLLLKAQSRKFDFAFRLPLAEILYRQQSELGLSPAQIQNINALKDEGTYTITTGHQLCLFGGPLYFIYKIISAISLSEAMNKEDSSRKYVPVFWMASEDHDFEEVNHFYLFGKKIQWNHPETKGAVGRLTLNGISEVVAQLKEVLGNHPKATFILELFNRHYRPEYTLAKATRSFVQELFGKEGLLILDADDASLKSLFAPAMQEELNKSFAYHAVNHQNQGLKASGYPLQIEAREINLFYLKDGLRARIEKKETGKFEIAGTSMLFSQEELLSELSLHPEYFSPNVVLRPLYQETILPNIAYFGGPGELAYWFQLTEVFKQSGTNFPLLLHRASFMVLDEPLWTKWTQAGFSAEDIWNNENDLKEQFLHTQNFTEWSAQSLKEELSAVYEKLKHQAKQSDQSLVASTEAEAQKALNGISQLESKINKALKLKFEQPLQSIKKVKEKLFPKGLPQERVENISQLLLKDDWEELYTGFKNQTANPPTGTVLIIS